MKRIWMIVCLLLTGCSTAPVADFLDYFFPGRLPPGRQLQQTGGVCIPQGGSPGGPAVPIVPPPQLPDNPPPGILPPPSVPGPGIAPGQGNPVIPPPASGLSGPAEGSVSRQPTNGAPVPFPQ